MSTLDVFLFGKFNVRVDGSTPLKLGIQKAQEMLCYLLVYRHRPHTREHLAGQLWPELSASQSKQYFRKTLWQIQSALDLAPLGSELLVVEDDWIQVNPAGKYWLDLDPFERAYHQVHRIDGSNLSVEQVHHLEGATSLYQGGLLLGWYQDWCLYERERNEHMYLVMLDKLIEHCTKHGEYEKGIQYGTEILRRDVARECTHRQVMYLLALSGDRTGALRQYEKCAAALARELNVEPAASTVEMYRQISSNARLAHERPSSVPDNNTSCLVKQLQETSEFLAHVKGAVTDLQGKLDDHLATLSHVLDQYGKQNTSL